MNVYVYGCARCGRTGRYIKMVENYAKKTGHSIEVLNSKYDDDVLFDHANWLHLAGLSVESYPAIVVDDNRVQLLDAWAS